MTNKFDVVVVGAGPAGSVAARRAAEAGLRTLLIEKRQTIGMPIRCAECIGADLSKQFIEPDAKWIDTEISHFAIHSSTGVSVPLPPTEPTLMVDRRIYDAELAHLAENAGTEIRTGTAAVGVILQNNIVTGVRITSDNNIEEIACTLLVAADGAESQVTRWAGMKTLPPLNDYYVGIEHKLAGLEGRLNVDMCEYHLNHALAPGGYLWVFPKSEEHANVGLVIPADHCKGRKPIEALDQFIARRYPTAKRETTIAGGIPVTGAMKTMVTNGLMAVGDAAHQADPMMGGGICLGMVGADMAMQVGVAAIREGNVSASRLGAYDKAWGKRFGRMHAALYKVRKILSRLEQSRIDALVARAAQLPIDTMPLSKVLLELLKKDPGLLFEARTLITTGLIMK